MRKFILSRTKRNVIDYRNGKFNEKYPSWTENKQESSALNKIDLDRIIPYYEDDKSTPLSLEEAHEPDRTA